MQDIVLSENLPLARGIKGNPIASALKFFRQPKSAEEAASAARMQNALLYSPSYEFDDGVLKELARRGGAVVFAFTDLLRERGFRRGITLSKMRLALAQCRKAECGFLVCTLAKNGNEVRSKRELFAFMAVLGMNHHEKEFAEKVSEGLLAGQAEDRQEDGKGRGSRVIA